MNNRQVRRLAKHGAGSFAVKIPSRRPIATGRIELTPIRRFYLRRAVEACIGGSK
jgi:hypothetical protein